MRRFLGTSLFVGRWWASFALIVIVVSNAHGQVASSPDSVSSRYPGLQPGMRVRVTSRTFGDYRPVGRVTSLQGDTLTFVSDSYGTPVKALLDDFTVIEVSASRITGSPEGALVGGYLGASVGVGVVTVIGLVALLSGDEMSDGEALVPLLLLGGAGALLGSQIGRAGRTDDWQVLVQFPVQRVPGPLGRNPHPADSLAIRH
ncbi:MAG: hypothetical protein ACKOC6_02285 [bacterium]